MPRRHCLISNFLVLLTIAFTTQAFVSKTFSQRQQGQSYPVTTTILFESSPSNEDEDNDTAKVKVGSKEYMQGFLSSPVDQNVTTERGTGLEQALKLSGGVVAVLAILFLGFMASNGLL